MKLLEQKIVSDGLALGTEIIKVDSFLNHQIDVAFLLKLGEEFHKNFSDCRPTKILTMEASGISVAVTTAMCFGNIPVVFAKKAKPSTMVEECYSAEVKSFTKGTVSCAQVSKKYLRPYDRILIIDDFLAHGEAATGLGDIVRQSGAELLGIGAVIEKAFQGGRERLAAFGCPIVSLARVEKIVDGEITFIPQD